MKTKHGTSIVAMTSCVAVSVSSLALADTCKVNVQPGVYSAIGTPPPPPGIEGWKFREELAKPSAALDLPPVGKGKTPWLENRISRCFFSPIKRPPFNRDELMDDVDYYPDAYLRRLANEGVNGLWLSVQLRGLAETSFTKPDPGRDRRIAKLRRTVDKCAKHGIKIFLFMIEPKLVRQGDPFAAAHPEVLRGSKVDFLVQGRSLCASEPVVEQYLYESVRDVFSRVPGLGGMINISNGERYTTCLSSAMPVGPYKIKCPKCAGQEPWQLHLRHIGPMVRGMRDAAPDARFLSWFYQPQPPSTRNAWVYECARHVPDGVTFLFNFESGSERVQEGKVRHGGDYWLSCPGPAAPFANVAAAAREAGTRLGAKIQMACSHEVATVPFVPVPGLLYRKFKAMKSEGVKDVMLCWYFGNSPGLMNRAAGELAYEDFAEDEDAFLLRLAREEWGEDAPKLAKLWRKFSDGYANYPLSINVQYYGPFHSSVNWPLLPDIELKSLARTWKPLEAPSGDFIGECLQDFSLVDAFELSKKMCAELYERDSDGGDLLDSLRAKYANDRDRRLDLGVMEALRLLFAGAKDVFEFYLLRRDAIFASRAGDLDTAKSAAAKMDAILVRQMEASRKMIPLCRDDSRLGFHSEAESHQFTAESLEWRIGALEKSRRRLDEIRAELNAGRPWPLSERERSAPAMVATRDADGNVVVEGDALGSNYILVYTTDLCGSERFRKYAATVGDGKFRVVVPAADVPSDPRLAPAWIAIYRMGAANWPDVPDFRDGKDSARLNIGMVCGDNYGRLLLK